MQPQMMTAFPPHATSSQLYHDAGVATPSGLPLSALIEHCQIEHGRFFRAEAYDERYAYELFRRAIVERNQLAWNAIYEHYAAQVDRWVQRSSAFARSGESSEYFVNAAFLRFSRAVTPEKFENFPSLAGLLNYLRHCAACAVIDSVRAQSWSEVLPEESMTEDGGGQVSVEDDVIGRLSRLEFWRYLSTQLRGEGEREVVLHSFVYGMKPGDIYERRRDLFSSVIEVYNIKRNVLKRLRGNPELCRMAGQS